MSIPTDKKIRAVSYNGSDIEIYRDEPTGDKRITPSTTEQTGIDVSTFATASCDAITKELLAALDADFTAANIKSGVDLFGLVGTFVGDGRPYATGTITPGYRATSVTVSGLAFTPVAVLFLAAGVGSGDLNYVVMRFGDNEHNVGAYAYYYSYGGTISYSGIGAFSNASITMNSGGFTIQGSASGGQYFYNYGQSRWYAIGPSY